LTILAREWSRPGEDGTDPQATFSEASRGLSLKEVFERFDPEPDPHFRAKMAIEAIPEEAPEALIRDRAAEAFAIDPDCVDAHLLLAGIAPDLEAEIASYRAAVEAGRRKHRALGGDGETRDPAILVKAGSYFEALHILADLHWLMGEFEDSRRVYEELLDADPGDPRMVRPALQSLAFRRGDFEDVAKHLEAEKDQRSAAVLYGRALLEFLRALNESPDFEPEMDSAEPFEKLGTVRMEQARKALREAFECSPWSVPFLLDSRVILLGPLPYFKAGDPGEALEFARMNFVNWSILGLPALWMLSEVGKWGIESVPVRRLRHWRDDFEAALATLDGIEPPDLSAVETGAPLDEFAEISEEIVDRLLERSGKRRPRRPGRGPLR